MDAGHSLKPLLPQQKESLIVLMAINFAERHDLLNAEQLADARASLRSLFLQATGAETMLRKLIGILNVNRAINQTFGEIARVLTSIRKASDSFKAVHAGLEQQLSELKLSPELRGQFAGPLVDYGRQFLRSVDDYDRLMMDYKIAKEAEARSAHLFRLARDARDRLRERFEPGASGESRQEARVKQKVIESFNYAEAETDYHAARRGADRVRSDIDRLLQSFHLMCQMAMHPDMRGTYSFAPTTVRGDDQIDIYSVCADGTARYPELKELLPAVQELLRLYQRSYGMFMLDFDKFNSALRPMTENSADYFQARDQDEEVRVQRAKLEKIEALIAFIEDVATLVRERVDITYPKFSIAVSARIVLENSRWSRIADLLLHMKVAAEAELTTRLG